MKKLLIPVFILIALGIYFALSTGSEILSYQYKNIRIAFEYPKYYVVTEKDDLVTIMLEEDYQSLENGEREGGEGPPAITIRQIDNPNNPGPREWAEQYPPQSNYNQRTTEVTETTVAGHPAVSYEADGLYPNRNVIIGTDYRLYYINGSYLEKDSPLYQDFWPLVESITVE